MWVYIYIYIYMTIYWVANFFELLRGLVENQKCHCIYI